MIDYPKQVTKMVVVIPFNGRHQCWDLEDGNDHYGKKYSDSIK